MNFLDQFDQHDAFFNIHHQSTTPISTPDDYLTTNATENLKSFELDFNDLEKFISTTPPANGSVLTTPAADKMENFLNENSTTPLRLPSLSSFFSTTTPACDPGEFFLLETTEDGGLFSEIEEGKNLKIKNNINSCQQIEIVVQSEYFKKMKNDEENNSYGGIFHDETVAPLDFAISTPKEITTLVQCTTDNDYVTTAAYSSSLATNQIHHYHYYQNQCYAYSEHDYFYQQPLVFPQLPPYAYQPQHFFFPASQSIVRPQAVYNFMKLPTVLNDPNQPLPENKTDYFTWPRH